uniref:Bradykinin receptor B2 n=1 Tax=Amphilophus citrinellus TaxID=61819 RepID=A0A3Q0S2Y1_AMPCI
KFESWESLDFGTVKMSGNQSNTNESHCIIDDTSLIFTLVPAYILVISVLALIFNISVLMVFCFHKKACTVAEIYLSNLAGVSLLPVYSLPFWADYVTNNLCICMYFLVLVSLDHYVALVHPLTHERMSRPLYAKLGCLFVWSFGLVFVLHKSIYRKLVPYLSNVTGCGFEYKINQSLMFEVRQTMFNFIIPISIIFFCTVRIIQAIRNRLPESLNTQITEQKTTTLILTVLLAFLICWVPLHVSTILDVFIKVDILRFRSILVEFQKASLCLAFFNSVLNPILYIITGKSFRRRAKEFFTQ